MKDLERESPSEEKFSPLSQVARQFGVSRKRLRNICQQHQLELNIKGKRGRAFFPEASREELRQIINRQDKDKARKPFGMEQFVTRTGQPEEFLTSLVEMGYFGEAGQAGRFLPEDVDWVEDIEDIVKRKSLKTD